MPIGLRSVVGESDCDLEVTFEAPPEESADREVRPLVPTKLAHCFGSHATSIGELWIQLLKFYAAKFDIENLVWFEFFDTSWRSLSSFVKTQKRLLGNIEAKPLRNATTGSTLVYNSQIITVRCHKKVTRTERNWSHRRLAVEDPTLPKHNLCKTVTSQVTLSLDAAEEFHAPPVSCFAERLLVLSNSTSRLRRLFPDCAREA